MKLKDIVEVIDGQKVCGHGRLNDEIDTGFASDLMSNVLAIQNNKVLLITGLINTQTLINHILLVREKKKIPALRELASNINRLIIGCQYSIFKTCGLLYKAGLEPVTKVTFFFK